MKMIKYIFAVKYVEPSGESRIEGLVIGHKDIVTEKLAFQFAVMKAFENRQEGDKVSFIELIGREED